MQKALHLEQALLANTHLNIQPEDLVVSIEKGKVINFFERIKESSNQNFKHVYDLHVYILNYSKDLESLSYILAMWMQSYCPGHNEDDLQFELDNLNNASCDMHLKILNVSEKIKVIARENGTELKHCQCAFPDEIILSTQEIAQLQSDASAS